MSARRLIRHYAFLGSFFNSVEIHEIYKKASRANGIGNEVATLCAVAFQFYA